MYDTNPAGGGPPGPTLGEVMGLAREAECEAETFYAALARMFPEPPEVAEFWDGMRRDERGHVAELDSIRNALTEEELSAPESADLMHKLREFLLYRASDLITRVETLDDAYKIAINLEFSEINKIMEILVTGHSRAVTEKARVAASINEHMQRLRGFPDRFGGSAWRRSIRRVGG